MTKHYNPSITEDAARILNSKMDYMSDEVSGPVAVIPIGPVATLGAQGSATNSTTGTVLTTPADKDFYITACTLSFSKDATATNTITNLRTTCRGAQLVFASLAQQTLTVQNGSVALNFNPPIKCDRGVVVEIANGTAVNNIRASATVTGYTVETTK